VIKWPVKLYVGYVFNVFFSKYKKRDFSFFELLHTFSRTLRATVWPFSLQLPQFGRKFRHENGGAERLAIK